MLETKKKSRFKRIRYTEGVDLELKEQLLQNVKTERNIKTEWNTKEKKK